ncbi:pyridoxamine 5'-phosphate oxidase family protein, partial [Rhizobium sp. L74/93]
MTQRETTGNLRKCCQQRATKAVDSFGCQLEANPNLALTFYWPLLGRQVRIRGTAVNAGSAERDTDFL